MHKMTTDLNLSRFFFWYTWKYGSLVSAGFFKVKARQWFNRVEIAF